MRVLQCYASRLCCFLYYRRSYPATQAISVCSPTAGFCSYLSTANRYYALLAFKRKTPLSDRHSSFGLAQTCFLRLEVVTSRGNSKKNRAETSRATARLGSARTFQPRSFELASHCVNLRSKKLNLVQI